ncbi:uncharacterized protein A4U43_C08F23690 [Asparagus officinalis]|nr:uncharacterized protein A4U43_C08F23690 [Asparagus officinalis]
MSIDAEEKRNPRRRGNDRINDSASFRSDLSFTLLLQNRLQLIKGLNIVVYSSIEARRRLCPRSSSSTPPSNLVVVQCFRSRRQKVGRAASEFCNQVAFDLK